MAMQANARGTRRALRPCALGAGVLLAAALLLGGCADPWQPGSESALATWSAADPEPGERLHCYRTLADVDCYRAPLPDGANRRVGWADAERRPVED
jgi:hypothetical protein